MRRLSCLLLMMPFLICSVAAPASLKVSENGRYLVNAEGQPFFYLADTAWELFHRLNEADAAHYLTRRAEQGFTVIQGVRDNTGELKITPPQELHPIDWALVLTGEAP